MNRLSAIAEKVVAGGLGPYGIKSLHYDITGIYNEFESGRETEAGAIERALRACSMFVKDNKAKPKATAKAWGFDLTDIKGSVFAKILRSVGANPDSPEDNGDGWTWKGNGVIVKTANNPMTGEPYSKRRELGNYPNEKDYASYIGIEGNPEQVKKVADAIRSLAMNIKDESRGTRDFI